MSIKKNFDPNEKIRYIPLPTMNVQPFFGTVQERFKTHAELVAEWLQGLRISEAKVVGWGNGESPPQVELSFEQERYDVPEPVRGKLIIDVPPNFKPWEE